jgi:hypothetical protein
MTGDLHVSEEFRKAKRNLVWLCSFAILIWLVRVPSDGTLQPPLLGGNAKVDVDWLRFVVWLACLYALIGFFRESKNVDRLNSEALYTTEFETIQNRLIALGATFEEFIEKSKGLAASVAELRFPATPDFERAPAQLLARIAEATNELDELIKKADKNPSGLTRNAALENLLRAHEIAQKGIELAVHTELRGITEALSDGLHIHKRLENMIKDSSYVQRSLRDLRWQFYTLSYRIRGEHRLLYSWYDKYLGYAMFMLSTAAALGPLAPKLLAPVSRLNAATGGWLFIAVAGSVLGLGYWRLNQSIVGEGRRKLEED